MIREWVPNPKLGFTVEVLGRADGWVEAVRFLAEVRAWSGEYRIPASREIEEYLEGKRRRFSHLDEQRQRVAMIRGDFSRRVLLKTLEIPFGRTACYSEIAAALSSRAWRAVGNSLSRNPIPLLVPCHRVVAKNGIGGFGGGVELKRKLLQLEGALS